MFRATSLLAFSGLLSLSLFIVEGLAAAKGNNVGLAIGGYGSSNSIELIVKDRVCKGSSIKPVLSVPPNASPTWVAEYVDEKIFLCGGQNLDQRRDCYVYDPKGGSSNFEPSCPMSTDRKYQVSLVVDGQMVIMGGYNDRQGWLDSVDVKPADACQFLDRSEWKMPRGMYNFCAVEHQNKIYTIGGSIYSFLENSDIANVDILDTKTNQWTEGEPLPLGRSSAACSIYEMNGEEGILVAGGCTNSCHEHLDDTLFYSFKTGKWTTLPAKLNVHRMGMKMILVDGKPTLVGGYDDRLLDSIEEFDGKAWHKRSGNLYAGRYQYGMPSALPENVFTCVEE